MNLNVNGARKPFNPTSEETISEADVAGPETHDDGEGPGRLFAQRTKQPDRKVGVNFSNPGSSDEDQPKASDLKPQ